MKYILIFILSFFLLVPGTYAVVNNYDRFEQDPGTGGGKSAPQIYEDLLNAFSFGTIFEDEEPIQGPTNNPAPSITGPIPTDERYITTTPINENSELRKALNELSNPISYNESAIAQVRNCLSNASIYREVQNITGVRWEAIVGLHHLETGGSCNPNKSCVSGRTIGDPEPDVGNNCSSSDSGLGKPEPHPNGGCKFSNLLDSCVYGANHLKGKIGKNPETLPEYAKAFARYNGLGNRNCGKTPYAYCPPDFDGDDHIYPMNLLDDKHKIMYLVYCADYTVCNPPKVFTRLGALAVVNIIINHLSGDQ